MPNQSSTAAQQDVAYDTAISSSADRCIWCMQPSRSTAPEHIIPQALGGPWTLPGRIVCASCNSAASHLDRAVADVLDVFAFLHGVQGKKKRVKPVTSRANFATEITPTGPKLNVNTGNRPVVLPSGKTLSGLKSSPRNVYMSDVQRDGEDVRFDLKVPLAFDRTAVRGILKIAYETVAYYLGAQFVYAAEFNAVRAFVRDDRGNRRAIIFWLGDTQYRLELNPPTLFPPHYRSAMQRVRIGALEFLADLSEESILLNRMQEIADQELGDGNWTLLPNIS